MPRRFLSLLVPLLVVVVAIVVIVIEIQSFVSYERTYIKGHKDDLSLLASSVASRIAAWRTERLADLKTLTNDLLLRRELVRWVDQARPHTGEDEDLARLLREVRNNYGYRDALLFGPGGELIAQADEVHSSAYLRFARQVLPSGLTNGPTILGMTRLAGTQQLLVPMVGTIRLDASRHATLVLLVDPGRDLYPMLSVKCCGETSLEMLLVGWRQGHVVFLSPLKYSREPPLQLRIAGNPGWLPAAHALSADTPVLEGRDYRGVSVFAAVHPIPGSPWAVVIKRDKAEVLRPVASQRRVMAVGLIGLFLFTFTVLGLWWAYQRRRMLVLQQRTEQERKAIAEHLHNISRYSNDAQLLLDARLRIVEANQRAEAMYGYDRDTLIGLDAQRLRSAKTAVGLASDLARFGDEGQVYETVHQDRNGREFPVEISARRLLIDDATFYHATIRDISERKRAEAEILRLSRLYRTLSRANEGIVQARSEDDVYQALCRVSWQEGGGLLVAVMVPQPETGILRVVAAAGRHREYLRGLEVTTAAGVAEGHGPSGVAMRENRVYIANDFATDPATGPWRERAASHGIRASGVFPLRRGGQSGGRTGVLCG